MFRLVFMTTGLRWLHSLDLNDMRNAIAPEDDDGPDGGNLGPAWDRARR
ncbi:hypothetical protein [Ruegeria marina]|uniref:Uncharacterized protein n=1 Tax=Ruegeria marina TaxID=639004 RepID=A0A1G6XG76_9RHOB|nr:hypothetical protein [Ruegeria marina]SDD77072.1 hypothetical protein SAMN04488239_11070 [Ruegeria marina]